jgi:transposase
MAKVLQLSLIDGKSFHAIHRETGLDRKTIRTLLVVADGNAEKPAPTAQRPSLLDAHDLVVRKLLEDAPCIRAPAVLERLRKSGYQGGITILRDRLRLLRPRPVQEAFLTRS